MKNRSERNKDYQTIASQVFKDKKLLVERPETMSYEEFKFLRTQQNLILKHLFHKGNSPNRNLIGAISAHKTLFNTGSGFRRKNFNRKSS